MKGENKNKNYISNKNIGLKKVSNKIIILPSFRSIYFLLKFSLQSKRVQHVIT